MALKAFDLTGKVAMVTGANSGLGQGMAVGLAEAGADIAGVGRSDMSETRAMVEKLGRRFVAVKAELRTTEHIPRILSETLSAFGRVDILINNAGTILRNDLAGCTEEQWDEVMNVNLKFLFFLSKAVAAQFVRQGQGGKIVNIASLLSFQGGARVHAYTASKSGVRGVTMALANELAPLGINVNAIAPGYMRTKNTRALQEDKARYQGILERIPAGRWGTPEDLKGPAVFLCSSASDYMHGVTMAVDGGWLGR